MQPSLQALNVWILACNSYGDYKLGHLLSMIPDKGQREKVRAVCWMK